MTRMHRPCTVLAAHVLHGTRTVAAGSATAPDAVDVRVDRCVQASSGTLRQRSMRDAPSSIRSVGGDELQACQAPPMAGAFFGDPSLTRDTPTDQRDRAASDIGAPRTWLITCRSIADPPPARSSSVPALPPSSAGQDLP
jgi:hypothetical protein